MEYQVGSFVFDEWRIVQRIGSGASGVVYEIQKTDHEITLTSALKVMRVPKDASFAEYLYDDGLDDQSVTSYLQGVVDELIGEIKLMVSMKGFPYIVGCEDYKVIRSPEAARWDILIRMELLESLQAYQREHEMTEADVHRLAVQLARALALFEERNIIHRDIKPENIFVTPYGDFKLGDFGIARVYDKASGNLSKKGTENYMAPEIYRGQDYDNTADIYSLGLVLYRALNKNRLPFYPLDIPYRDIDRQQAMVDRLCGKKPLQAPALASPELGRIVLKMCAYRQEERYQSAGELLRDLEAVNPSGQVVLSRTNSSAHGKAGMEEKEGEPENATQMIFSEKPSVSGGDSSQKTPGQSQHGRGASTGQSQHGRGSSSGQSQAGEGAASRQESGVNREVADQSQHGRGSSTGQSQREKDTASGQVSEPERERGRNGGHGGSSGSSRRYQSGTGRREGQQESRDSGSGKRDSRKHLIQMAAAAAIVVAIVIPLLMSRKYELTVNGGSGSGTYQSGTSVTVRAQEVEGSSFAGWETAGIKLSEEEASRDELTLKMPRKKVTLTALFEENEYTVTVNHGSGSGTYKLNDTVSIQADEPEEGYAFDGWEINSGYPAISDPSAQSASFEMGEEDVVITAVFEPLEYELLVDGADGSGAYTYGERIVLEAEEMDHNTFEGWIVEQGTLDFTAEELAASRLVFDMPAQEIWITAKYQVNSHGVTVNNGQGSGTYAVGDKVTIVADAAAEGSQFTSWKVKEGSVSLRDQTEPEVSFTMPDEAVEITAQYDLIDYALNVNNGSGGGAYHLGDQVTISADPVKDGMAFSYWTVDKGTLALSDLAVANISFVMPAEEVTLTAHYAVQKYTLKVTNGTGSGMYSAGDQVEIEADSQDTQGNAFGYWSVVSGKLDFEGLGLDPAQPALSFQMPEQNLELQANYTTQPAGDYVLTVNGGSGSGIYGAGDTVQIIHEDAPVGMRFAYWLLNQAGADAVTYKSEVLTLTMPANDVVVTAVFEDQL